MRLCGQCQRSRNGVRSVGGAGRDQGGLGQRAPPRGGGDREEACLADRASSLGLHLHDWEIWGITYIGCIKIRSELKLLPA